MRRHSRDSSRRRERSYVRHSVRQQPEQYTIKVNHLPSDIDEDDLEQEYAKYGDIASLKLNASSSTESYAFINFENRVSALNALEKTNGRSLFGNIVTVTSKLKDSAAVSAPIEQYTLKVTNLSPDTTQEEMEEICQAYRDFQSLKVIKGYAFVNFLSREGAESAIKHLNRISARGKKWSAKFRGASSPPPSPCPSAVHNKMISTAKPFPSHQSIAGPSVNKQVRRSPPDSVPLLPPHQVLYGPAPQLHPGYAQFRQPFSHSPAPFFQRPAHAPPFGYPFSHPPVPLVYGGTPVTSQPNADQTSIKVTINGDGITSEDLVEYFGQFGSILNTPKIIKGSPDHSYVVFKTNQEAVAACQQKEVNLKGTKLAMKLSNTKPVPPSVGAQKQSKIVKCDDDPLVNLILSKHKLAELQSNVPSSCEPHKDGGVILSGDKDKLSVAEPFVGLHIQLIRKGIVSETARIDCQCIPVLQDPQIFQNIEENNCVEFNVLLSDDSKKSLVALSNTVGVLSANSYPMTLESISEYLCSETSSTSVTWEFVDDNDQYVPMSADDSAAVEKLYNAQSQFAPATHTRGKWQYCYDFQKKMQTNLSTGKVRKIKRVLASSCSSFLKLSCRGLPEHVQISIDALKMNLELSMTQKTFGNCTGATRDTIAELARSFCIEVDSSSTEDGIVLSGASIYLAKVILILKEKQLQLPTSSSSASYPPEWEPQDSNVELKTVSRKSQEWKDIESQVKATMPDSSIIKIERIQNKFLYEKYSACKKRMLLKNNGVINEKRLFHGSSDVPPKKIYESECGFDFRFSNPGLWGRGAYFAVNASYSGRGRYSFTSPQGSQIFMAFVLTGQSKAEPRGDSSLVAPPLKYSNSEERYDSVNGHSGSSQIFVVYDHDKSYPAYLITFRSVY